VFGAIILESSTIATLGVTIGFAFYAGFIALSAHYIADMTGVVINPMEPNAVMALAPVGIVALGTLAGILPAMKAYRTDVAENLIPQT
jgi:putative ABC transport system permease protein